MDCLDDFVLAVRLFTSLVQVEKSGGTWIEEITEYISAIKYFTHLQAVERSMLYVITF